jgi:hypothetical protein
MRLALAFLLISLVACGGGDKITADAAQDIGFNKPTATLKANMAGSAADTWVEIGDADLTSCATDTATTAPVMLKTMVVDFQNQTAVPNAKVIAFPTITPSAPFDTQTSDADGNITFTIPAGTKRFAFEMTADMQFPTFLLNQYLTAADIDVNGNSTEPATIQSVSDATAALLPALIGQTRASGTGVVAGAVRDCGHHEISNYVATVSSTSGTATPIKGAQSFYFSLSPELPEHHSQAEASGQNALFMGIQLPATDMAYVQAWGFPTAADLASGEMKLVSELAVPILGDTVVTASFEPIHN